MNNQSFNALLSNTINLAEFQHRVISDPELESLLDVPLAGQGGSLLYLVLDADPRSPADVLATRNALMDRARSLGVDISPPQVDSPLDAAVDAAIPPWLNPSPRYLADVIAAIGPLPAGKFEKAVRRRLESEFRCQGEPPRWLHESDWPLRHGVPGVFLGQLDAATSARDNCQVFVFWHESDDQHEVIRQRA